MTIIMGMSELLLAQVESGSPLIVDLNTLVREVKRMGEMVEGITGLTSYEIKHQFNSGNLKVWLEQSGV